MPADPSRARLPARNDAHAGSTPVKVTSRRAAEIYEVTPGFRRFDASRNMVWQVQWNAGYRGLPRAMTAARARRLGEGEPGYGRLDAALMDGAAASMQWSAFGTNVPWWGGNSWRRLSLPTHYVEVPLPPPEAAPLLLKPAQASAAVKRAARVYGADLVGVAPLDRRWVYSHYYDPVLARRVPIVFSDEPGGQGLEEPARLGDGTLVIPASVNRAVVVAVEMDLDGIRSGPALREMAVSMVGYARLQAVVLMLAEFIRSLGYHAIPSSNCTALSIPLAIDAGLGELGRNAKLITPRFGPRVRLGKVLTNMPLLPDRCVQFGVLDFCASCRRCANECPAGAIPAGDRSYEPNGDFSHSHVRQYQIDHRRCFEYWTETGTNCGICLAVCPYNKGVGWVRGVAVTLGCGPEQRSLDDIFGYGRSTDLGRYWE